MRTIVFVVPHLRKTGPTNVLLSQCLCLDRERFTPIIITLFEEKSNSNIEAFKRLNIRIFCLNANYVKLMFCAHFYVKQIENVCDSYSDVIIHAHCHWPTVLISKIKKYKTISTIHNICGEDYVLMHGKLLGCILIHQFTNSLRNIDIPVAISYYMKEYYSRYSKSIVVVHNGVSTTSFCNHSREMKLKLELPLDKKMILVTGHINHLKNTLYIVSELSKSSRNDFYVVFIGKGELLEECKNKVINDKRFVFRGFVNNVDDYLDAANCYVSASLSEGLPMAVLEALNKGLPCMLSGIKPHLEIVRLMNMNGVESFELKEDSLFKSIELFMDNTYNQYGISEKAAALFSSSVMQKKYEALYSL